MMDGMTAWFTHRNLDDDLVLHVAYMGA
jgi:hypothetical protein